MAKKKEEVKEVTEVATPAPAPVEQAAPVAPVAPVEPKKGGKTLPIILIGVVALLAIALICVYTMTSSPKAIFKNTVNRSYKEVAKEIKVIDKYLKYFNPKENALTLDMSAKFDAKAPDLEEEIGDISRLKVNYSVGTDLRNKEFLIGLGAEGDRDEVDGQAFYKDGDAYLKLSFYEDLIKVTTEDLDVEEVEDLMDEYLDKIDFDADNYDYIAKKIANAVNKSLNSKAMSKSKGTMEVDGKTVKANKVTYTFDKEEARNFGTKVIEILLEDDKFIDAVAKSTGAEKGDVKDLLKDMKDGIKDIDFKGEYKINIYTKGLLNKVVGFSFEYKDKEYLTVFQNGKTTEFTIDNHEKEYDQFKFVATMVEEKGKKEINIRVNKEKVGTVIINELTEEVCDVEFKIDEDGDVTKFNIYIEGKQKKNVINGEYKVRVSYKESGEKEQYVEVSGDYKLEASDELDTMSTKDAVSYEDVDGEELVENFQKAVEKDEVLNNVLGDIIDEFDDAFNDYNYYGMKDIEGEAELKKVLANTKPTVLYAGSTYYSYYYNQDAAYLFEYLRDAQDDYDFHSYFLDDYGITGDMAKLLGVDKFGCDEVGSRECAAYPSIYFIKDGKIQKELHGKVTYEDIEAALELIGLA